MSPSTDHTPSLLSCTSVCSQLLKLSTSRDMAVACLMPWLSVYVVAKPPRFERPTGCGGGSVMGSGGSPPVLCTCGCASPNDGAPRPSTPACSAHPADPPALSPTPCCCCCSCCCGGCGGCAARAEALAGAPRLVMQDACSPNLNCISRPLPLSLCQVFVIMS